MDGIAIQYLLGVFFLVSSLGYAGGRISADWVRFLAGIILIVLAVIGWSPIG